MENNKTVNFNDFRKEAKKREREEWINKYIKAPIYMITQAALENPVAALGTISAIAIPVIKHTGKVKAEKIETKRRLTEFWDPRVGKYARIKRPLTRQELVMVDRRYVNDKKETYTNIFNDMGILKP